MEPEQVRQITEALITILSIIGGSGLLAALLPNAKANALLAVLKIILNLVGANWGAAENKDRQASEVSDCLPGHPL